VRGKGGRFEGAPPIAEADTMLNEASLATRWVLTATSLRRPGRGVEQVVSASEHGGFCALYVAQGERMPQLVRLFVDARDELHAPQSTALNAPMMVFRRMR
jgi:inactivated superfamily I helicase